MRNIRKGYGYDDLLLVPRFSELESRDAPDISCFFSSDLILDVPIISAAMDSITEETMASWIAEQGGLGIIHRYMSIEEQKRQVEAVHKRKTTKRVSVAAGARLPVGASIGSNDSWERAEALLSSKVDLIAIDVAHGDSKSVYNMIKRVKDTGTMAQIMSGNIVTAGAAHRAAQAGADILRVGIGAGGACTTRLVAGVGVPQITAIHEIHTALPGYPIVADGGIRTSGDIVKALAAGASAVMVGSRFAPYPWTPKSGTYRGMASDSALSEYKMGRGGYVVEGSEFTVTPIGEEAANNDWEDLVGGIRQGLSYLGAKNVETLQHRANWMEVSNLGYQEGEAHFERRS